MKILFEVLNIAREKILFVYLLYLILLTVMMPIIGNISLRYASKSLLKMSAIGVAVLSIPFYFSVSNHQTFWVFVFLNLMVLLLCIQFSFLPSFIAGMFPTAVRFTCIGFSFNVTDGVIGGAVF